MSDRLKPGARVRLTDRAQWAKQGQTDFYVPAGTEGTITRLWEPDPDKSEFPYFVIFEGYAKIGEYGRLCGRWEVEPLEEPG